MSSRIMSWPQRNTKWILSVISTHFVDWGLTERQTASAFVHYQPLPLLKDHISHSARRPWSLKGHPSLDPYESFRASFFFADVEMTLHWRRVHIRCKKNVQRMPCRKRTSCKLSYGSKVWRSFNVMSECDVHVLWTTLAKKWVYPLRIDPI